MKREAIPLTPTDSGRRKKRLLKPEKTRIVGKRSDHERLQEYRPPQQARKRVVELNIQICNCLFRYCETRGTTHTLGTLGTSERI